MSDLATSDTTADLELTNGDLTLSKGVDAVKQALRQELKMFAGEWFLDLDYGVPYYKNVLVKKPNTGLIRGIFEETILATPGVLELTSLSLDYNSAARTLTVSFTARAFDGEINFMEVLGGSNG